MTVDEMLSLLQPHQKQAQLLLRDDANPVGKTKPVRSVSIRVDEDGQTFVIVHPCLAQKLPAVADPNAG